MKRKLKKVEHRKRQDNKVQFLETVNQVSKETGFSKEDIKIVLRSYFSVIRGSILSGFSVILPNIGTLTAFLRASKYRSVGQWDKDGNLTHVNKTVPARYAVKLWTSNKFSEEVKKMEVTKEAEDALYED